nr:hypothetical protein [Actinomycetales bacterium]
MRASAPRGVSLVIGLTAIAATTVEIVVPEEGLLTVVLAFGVVGTFLQQMFRRDGRPRLAESVSVAVSGIIVVISVAGWITAVSQVDGLPLVLVTAAALALAAGSMYLPGPSSIAVIAACAAPTVVAALLGGLLPGVEPVPAALLGFAAGTMVAATHILFLRFRSLPLPSTGLAAAVLAPLALGLPVAQLAAFVL